MTRWRQFARWSGFGCEVCGRLRFAYGPLCRACATEDFDRTARVYAVERYGIEVEATPVATQPAIADSRAGRATDQVIRSRGTTWGYLRGAPPPWPADCFRCGQQVGVYGEAEVDRMSYEIFRHVQRCTWWWDLARLAVRSLRGPRRG